MRILLDALRETGEFYSNLKLMYGRTFGLWFFKRKFLQRIGIFNGRKRLRLIGFSDTDELLAKKIKSGNPFMFARYGSTEFRNMFSENDLDLLCFYSGFFPNKINLLKKFRSVYFESSKMIDILEVWNYRNHFKKELSLIEKLPNIEYISEGLLPDFASSKWVSELKEKRVLVVHPFKKTIETQYKKSSKIGILPRLGSLEVIRAVQTIAGNKDKRFSDWFDALDFMKREISKKNFDIAIIGCGAYGLPLAAHVKSMGKQAMHLGGSSQLLFGIRGKRWAKNDYIKFNKHWIYPLEEDTPSNNNKVEGGCYWK